ncbi:hypothetical protein EC880221_2930, partial [Escherichia coli 88.0221]
MSGFRHYRGAACGSH